LAINIAHFLKHQTWSIQVVYMYALPFSPSSDALPELNTQVFGTIDCSQAFILPDAQNI